MNSYIVLFNHAWAHRIQFLDNWAAYFCLQSSILTFVMALMVQLLHFHPNIIGLILKPRLHLNNRFWAYVNKNMFHTTIQAFSQKHIYKKKKKSSKKNRKKESTIQAWLVSNHAYCLALFFVFVIIFNLFQINILTSK